MKKFGLFSIFVVGLTAGLVAQGPVPVRGTIALEGTMRKFYRGVNTIVVTTLDGMDHVYHFTKDLVVHGGKGSGVGALEGLRGTVVVHYTIEGTEQSAQEIDRIGDEGLMVTEGAVVQIDRVRKQITLRLDSGRTETLRLTDRAAVDAGTDIDPTSAGTTKVVVYYSDTTGQKVVHFIKKTS